MDRFEARARRVALRAQAIAFLGGKCQVCGYDRCPEGLDFHHLDPDEKDFDVSDRLTSWAAIEPELRKCALLCACCHREVHAGLHPRFLALDLRGGDGFFCED